MGNISDMKKQMARETELLRKKQEGLRLIQRRIIEAQKTQDLRSATELIRVLRAVAPGFFGDGQLDGPLLVGALIDVHGKLAKGGEVHLNWTTLGAPHFSKPTRAASPGTTKTEAAVTNSEPQEAVAAPLESLDTLFNATAVAA